MSNGLYGLLQNYVSPNGSGRWETAPGWTPQTSGLPQWIQDQFYWQPGDPNAETPTEGHWALRGMQDQPFGAVLDQTGNRVVQLGDPNTFGDPIIDRSQIRNDPYLGAVTTPGNIHDTFYDQSSFRRAAPFLAAFLGAGLGLTALGAGAGSTAGMAATDVAESGGTLGLNAAGNAVPYGAGAGATASSLPESYWNTLAQNGATDALPEGAPVTDLSTNAGSLANSGNYAPVTDLSHGAGAFSSFLADPSLTTAGGLLSSVGTYALGHPLQAVGVAQTVAGLLGRGGGSHPGSSNSSGNKSGGPGASGVPMSIQRPQWTPNPYTLAQLQQFGGGGF